VKVFACIFLLLALVMTAAAADVTGKWSGTVTAIGDDGKPEAPNSAYLILKQSGATLTGTGGPEENEQWPMENGKIAGNKITGTVTAPDGSIYALTMTVDGDHMAGDVVVTQGGETRKGKVELKKVQ
jgi:hypothetical protein